MRRILLGLLLPAVVFLPTLAAAPTPTIVADRHPPHVKAKSSATLGRQSQKVNCETDGDEGKRILAVYLYPDGQQNDYGKHVVDIRRALGKIDAVWNAAAAPYDQHPRWECNAHNSRPTVVTTRGPAVRSNGTYTLADVLVALRQAGLISSDRIYLVFVDHIGNYPYGGQATVDPDDRADASNRNNIGPAYAMVDAEKNDWAWNAFWDVGMHELIHALGGVQCSAPHSSCPGRETVSYHCWDGSDIMCYDDNGSYYRGDDGKVGTADDRTVADVCDPNSSPATQLDCGKNDYFNVAPEAGSYLATHWNLARSSFVTPLRRA